jgi:hypothetical protein
MIKNGIMSRISLLDLVKLPTSKSFHPIPVNVADIKGSHKYIEKYHKIAAKIGQRKLLMSEIDFLTQMLDNYDQPAVMVYVGSAPGHHIHVLAQLFPRVKFILFDAEPHTIYIDHARTPHWADSSLALYLRCAPRNDGAIITIMENGVMKRIRRPRKHYIGDDPDFSIINYANMRYFIYEGYFTSEHAQRIKDEVNGDIFLVSDIRTATGGVTGTTSEEDVMVNSMVQYLWHNIMSPVASLMKFRHVFKSLTLSDLREVAKNRGMIKDFDEAIQLWPLSDLMNELFPRPRGDVRIQVWSGGSSSETRLMIIGDIEMIEESRIDYEEKLAWFNMMYRTFLGFNNDRIDYFTGYDNSYDAARDAQIWDMYEQKYARETTDEFQLAMDAIISYNKRNRSGNGGGYFRRNGNGYTFHPVLNANWYRWSLANSELR